MTDDWFVRTSQRWKLRVFDALALVLLGAGGAAMLALDGAALGSMASLVYRIPSDSALSGVR